MFTLVFRAALCTIVKKWNQPTCSSTENRTNWYNPTWEYYSAIKHNQIMALAAVWMHQDIILSEVGWSEKDKCHKISQMGSVNSYK